MEQAELRAWEHKCIQEETPWCTAACPIHVDAREFCSLMAQRRWDKAWALLARTMPLPGVLARMCGGTCESACIRAQAGGAVGVSRLERFCADNSTHLPPPRPLPSRNKSVAVMGGGMTGLCAAWEMARRGFDVTLLCDAVGVGLRDLPDTVLPAGVLDREIASLRAMGVVIETGVQLSRSLIESLLEEKDAVFIDGNTVSEAGMLGEPDELTLGTRLAGLFASPADNAPPEFQAAAARRAANSVERFTQGVSMVSGRELEGPYQTRLFTSLTTVEPVAPVQGSSGWSEADARDEARRCLQCECMECVNVCEYLKHYKQYPKVYARRIYNNASIVMGTRQANTMINSCMLCGLCQAVCPEDFSMADLCLEARRSMVELGTMPPSTHEFALRDMAFANGDSCALARHAPAEDSSDYLFFPGCQLTASDPDGVHAAYADLRARLGRVGLMLRCCGAPAHWAGRQSLADQSLSILKGEWEQLGSPRIIAACPTCLKTLRQWLPDAEIVSHWSALRAMGLPGGARADGGTLTVGDPCSARHDTMLREDVRTLLDRLGVDTVEPELNGELAQCCGFGGLLAEANPELGQAVAQRRADELTKDFVTYCVMCRDRIARMGKRALHLYDLLYPGDGEPGSRPAPGYSDRRENRTRLCERLLRELWNTDQAEAEPHEAVQVAFTDEAARLMENRRILRSDVQKVLYHATRTGAQFVHDETDRLLASWRPSTVAYWVEYEPQNDGFMVHRAWCHRMRVRGGQS
ncbi:pyridine nucleotide-disulfide oxidoreductase/dicluster-binding protein [Pseudodesulfovibrio pelocollis]|uniref:pyridine nucleotide-disulfide oxidoreductase/dicluster-binding protein n=1 Tax=Pseudodesulfovibrio pelocollis TaxID=3051432 RepID=UPI00255AD988|nr:pyridine nucleotide-disulfide oxidoreductase/dicluster-binding protein [Pseudodesulfovibrio sp. SB368]